MTKPYAKTDELLDDVLRGCKSSADILGEHVLLKGLRKRLVERALAAELTNSLGYAPHAPTNTNVKEGKASNGFTVGRSTLRSCNNT